MRARPGFAIDGHRAESAKLISAVDEQLHDVISLRRLQAGADVGRAWTQLARITVWSVQDGDFLPGREPKLLRHGAEPGFVLSKDRERALRVEMTHREQLI